MNTEGHPNDGSRDAVDRRLAKERRQLRWAGVLVIAGLVVEAVTLFWSHPTAFVFFAVFGISFVLLGILIYLWVLLRGEPVAVELSPSGETS